jgi:ribosomal protein L11 methyltransferase
VIRLAVRCRAADAERVLAELLELAPSGVEEVSEPDGQAATVEYAVYGAPGELPDLGRLRAAVGGALVDVTSEPVPEDWNERWKRFYFPVQIGGRLYVRPPWERAVERGGVTEVVIDPGRAFGTGTHATTRMCLELLLDRAPPARGPAHLRRLFRASGDRPSFCDLGCGSGVLAIAAAKLGFEPVLALDADGAALEETSRNARANYVEVDSRGIDLRSETAPIADVVTANLTARLLDTVAERWSTADIRPGAMIVSGLLVDEADHVSTRLAGAGLHEVRRLRDGEWAALLSAAVK